MDLLLPTGLRHEGKGDGPGPHLRILHSARRRVYAVVGRRGRAVGCPRYPRRSFRARVSSDQKLAGRGKSQADDPTGPQRLCR
jgi:hypothetical protein